MPDRGLTPTALRNSYNLGRLAADGFTGKGTTIVFFAFDGFDQSDLDMFADDYRLPKFTPTLVGGQPSEPRGETTMDLEVAHAIAPDATKVVINARPTVEGDGAFEKIWDMFESADRRSFPVRCGAFRSAGAATSCTRQRIWRRCGRRCEPHTRTAPRRSTPVVISPAWNAVADRTGRLRRVRRMSAWTRWPRCRR